MPPDKPQRARPNKMLAVIGRSMPMSGLNEALNDRWRSTLASARKRHALTAKVVLEGNRLTIFLSNGKTFSASRTVSEERALTAAVQWARRQGATDVTVLL